MRLAIITKETRKRNQKDLHKSRKLFMSNVTTTEIRPPKQNYIYKYFLLLHNY